MADKNIRVVVSAKDQASKTMQAFGKNTAGAMKAAQKSIENFSATAKRAGATLSAIGAAGVLSIKKLASAAGDVEQLRVAFTTMLGSAEEADAFLRDLADFASRTPFTMPGVETAAKRLLAFGFSTEETKKNLKSLGDVAAGLSLGEDGFNRLIFNLGQVRAQGKLTGRELRDFAANGVPLIEELAKVMGVAEKEIADLVATGKVTGDIVVEAFENMSAEGGRFANLMEKQNATLLGQFSNLQDNMIQLARTLGEPLIEPLKRASQILIRITEVVGEFVKNNPRIAQVAASILLVGTAFAAIAGPALIFIGFIPTIIAGLTAVGTAFTTLGGPILAITAALAALFIAWETNFLGIQEITQTAVDFFVPLLVDGFNLIKETAIEVGQAIITAWNEIAPIITGIWEEIQPIVEIALQLLMETIKVGFEAIKVFTKLVWNQIKFFVQTSWNAIKLLLKLGLALITLDWKLAWGAIREFMIETWNSMKEFVISNLEAMKELITAAWDFITELFGKFAEGVTSIWGGLWEGMKSVTDTAANFIIDIVQTLVGILAEAIEKLQSLLSLAGGGIKKAASFAGGLVSNTFRQVKSDFGFARGGRPQTGQPTIVGERGPEIFTPDSAGTVIPNSRAGFGGTSVVVNVSGNTLLDEDAGEAIGDMIAQKLQLQLRLQ